MGEKNLNQPEGGQKMGHCGAAREFCSCQRKLAATRVVKGCREKYHSRDYIYIYKLPNLKKIETGNFITELVCPGSVPGLPSLAVSSYCCCSSLCLVSMFPSPAGCAGRQAVQNGHAAVQVQSRSLLP